jgi:hypothetical protein
MHLPMSCPRKQGDNKGDNSPHFFYIPCSAMLQSATLLDTFISCFVTTSCAPRHHVTKNAIWIQKIYSLLPNRKKVRRAKVIGKNDYSSLSNGLARPASGRPAVTLGHFPSRSVRAEQPQPNTNTNNVYIVVCIVQPIEQIVCVQPTHCFKSSRGVRPVAFRSGQDPFVHCFTSRPPLHSTIPLMAHGFTNTQPPLARRLARIAHMRFAYHFAGSPSWPAGCATVLLGDDFSGPLPVIVSSLPPIFTQCARLLRLRLCFQSAFEARLCRPLLSTLRLLPAALPACSAIVTMALHASGASRAAMLQAALAACCAQPVSTADVAAFFYRDWNIRLERGSLLSVAPRPFGAATGGAACADNCQRAAAHGAPTEVRRLQHWQGRPLRLHWRLLPDGLRVRH